MQKETTEIIKIRPIRLIRQIFRLTKYSSITYTNPISKRKTDVYDCQWIRQLYICGLLRSAFRPATEILPIRSYWRQRKNLTTMCATSIHHMQKSLELMNVQLHKAITGIAGAIGMKILRSIVAG